MVVLTKIKYLSENTELILGQEAWHLILVEGSVWSQRMCQIVMYEEMLLHDVTITLYKAFLSLETAVSPTCGHSTDEA